MRSRSRVQPSPTSRCGDQSLTLANEKIGHDGDDGLVVALGWNVTF